MEIELSRLTAAAMPVAGDIRLSDTGGGGRSLASQGIRFPEAFRFEGTAQRPDSVVLVTGRVTGRVRLECGRCLAPVDQLVDTSFTARFVPEPERPAAGDGNEENEEGIELEGNDLDVSYLPAGATALSVEEMVREQVLLDIPLRPLCRDDCAGLCPRCGADLNAGACGCPAESDVDPRLAPLLELKKRLKDE